MPTPRGSSSTPNTSTKASTSVGAVGRAWVGGEGSGEGGGRGPDGLSPLRRWAFGLVAGDPTENFFWLKSVREDRAQTRERASADPSELDLQGVPETEGLGRLGGCRSLQPGSVTWWS